MTSLDHIQWLSDLIRIEIILWNRINARLLKAHNLSLAFFESLYFIEQSADGTMRIGDLARSMCITVGATSKLVDRIASAGFIRRELDAEDRRASRVVLTDAGRQALSESSTTYKAELASLLDATLTPDEQQHVHILIKRLLTAADKSEAV